MNDQSDGPHTCVPRHWPGNSPLVEASVGLTLATVLWLYLAVPLLQNARQEYPEGWLLPAARVVSYLLCLATALVGTALLVATLRRRGPRINVVKSAAAIMVGVLGIVIVASVTNAGRDNYGLMICRSNLKQLGLAMAQYSQDYGVFPQAASWNEALKPYVKSDAVLICPSAPHPDQPSYAMNSKVAGLKLKQIREPADVVLLFESVQGRNMAGGPELLPSPSRHRNVRGLVGIVFADGHVKWVYGPRIGMLSWDPGRVVGRQH